MSDNLLDKGYEPREVENRWYTFWEANHLFAAKEESSQKSYSIVIPPPNVTGVLHMGHALNITMQDILCRYRRLLGDNVLWMPGTDHAGIATQNVVEKKLAAEGTDRHQLGREKFIDAVWDWRTQYGSAIINQLKRLGASCDWDRERFTMDEGLSRAVRKVFVQLYNEGLIYQGNYIINWCPRCQTALSDLEVEHEELDGNLYHITYPFADGQGGLVVATTRPETMFGDTAVALNPEDERYVDIQSDRVILPLVNKEIPIIRDHYVGLSFGTGALKVTPAHDPNDFEIGVRHGLPSVKGIDDNGIMTSGAGRFEGLDRFECREEAVKSLEDEGLLVKIEPYKHNVGHCYRCKTVVEPSLSKQWFVKVGPLADKAIKAVENNDTKIIPEIWTQTYFNWMRNIKDWCISRQIWWGHQIPAWKCKACNEIIVALDTPDTCGGCGCTDLEQDTDVLDTWFSSALWPFSTMGWPDRTKLLKTFYPTSVLITGFDILFFWVARMMMMGIHFMEDVPFHDVYVHALVRDEDGKKMSKSKGNVIDPLTVIEEYGTDAFRFTLAAFAAQGRDIKMSEKRVEGYRHFINKLWNAARFSLMHIERDYDTNKTETLSLPDKWILSRLHTLTDTVSRSLDGYRFNDAAGALYKFVWHEFCDWYLEIIKPVLYDKTGQQKRESTLCTLAHVLRNVLILLHPFVPFVTEEIWHKLPATSGSIMEAAFPETDAADAVSAHDPGAEANMETIIEIISGIRNVRGEMNIIPSLYLDVLVHSQDQRILDTVNQNKDIIINLARLESFSAANSVERPQKAATAVAQNASIFVSLEGIIDFKKEKARLEKEIGKLAKDLEGISKKLGNENFLNKAPEDVVNGVREKRTVFLEKQEKLQTNLEKIKEFVV